MHRRLSISVSSGPVTTTSSAIAAALACSPGFAQQMAQASARQAPTDSLVTIATGNKFQRVLPSSTTDRRLLRITNNNTNGDTCWVFVGGGRASKDEGDEILTPGKESERYWPFVPSDEVQVTCVSSLDTLAVETR